MRKTTRLRHLIEREGLLVMPGAYDPFSAKMVARAGYDAIQCTGLGISGTLLGMPDYSVLGLSDMAMATQRIVDSVELPVMADGDTGFGNAVNVHFSVRAFERAGAAGVNLEDQVMPKRCGHLDGKSLVSIEEGTTKIRAAADARIDPDFVINARTDALATEGIGGVIRRGNAYLEAGATMIFVEGTDTLETIKAAVKGIRGPVGVNIVHGGKSRDFDLKDLERAGVARVSLPGILLQAAIQAMDNVLAEIRDSGSALGIADQLYRFEDAHALMGTTEVMMLEERYLAPLKDLEARP